MTQAESLVAETILKRLSDHFPENIQNITYAYAFCLNGCVGLIKTWSLNDDSPSPQDMAQMTYQFVENTVHYYLEKCKEM